MDIDIVYTYVDGNDEKWKKKRNHYSNDSINSVFRYRDNNELLYSLRSLEKYAPWVRNIYIITDHQKPEWLNTSHKKIHVVDHTEIIPKEFLPCFNSMVIELYLDLIPGLSEIFLYANDDMFFGNYATKEFFVKDGKPIVLMREAQITPNSNFNRALYNSQQLVYQHYGIKYDLVPSHNIDVYSKEALKKCKNEFASELQNVSKNRLRTDNDIERVLYQYYMIANHLCVLKANKPGVRNVIRKLAFPKRNLDYLSCAVMHDFFNKLLPKVYFMRKPKLFCLNDGETTTEEDLEKYRKLMDRMFPEKSSFEY